MTHPAYPFVQHILPAQGPYVWLFKDLNGPNGRPILRQRSTETVADLLTVLYDRATKGIDTYYGVGSYKEKLYKEMRAVQNVRHVRSVWHDIDVGKIGAYQTREEAIAAVDSLVAQGVILEPTYYVNSGNGVHIYWCLDDDLDVESWMTLSAQTYRAIKSDAKMCVDVSRIQDFASIMRMPGTWNFKDPANPLQVLVVRGPGKIYTTEDFDNFYGVENLELFMPKQGKVGGKLSDSSPDHWNHHIGPPIMYSAPVLNTVKVPESGVKVRAADLIRHCAQISYFAVNQHEQTYEMWRNMLGCMKVAKGGREAAHIISKGYPTYDPDEVDGKLDEWGKYWPKCETIRASSPRPMLCEGCPANTIHGCTAVKHCLDMAKLTSSTTVPAPATPAVSTGDPTEPPSNIKIIKDIKGEPYEVVDPIGIYFHKGDNTCGTYAVTKDDGEVYMQHIAICSGLLNVNKVVFSQTTQSLNVQFSYRYKEDHQLMTGEIAISQINGDPKMVFAALGTVGCLLPPEKHKRDKLLEFIRTSAMALMNEHKRYSISYDTVGWTNTSGDNNDPDESFVLPYGLVKSDGVVTRPTITEHLRVWSRGDVERRGTIEGWRAAVEPLLHKDKFFNATFGLLLGFAAPLVKFSTDPGGTVCFYGQSKAGKSVGLEIAKSVFGTPDTEKAIKTNDTEKSVPGQLIKYGNIAAIWDEITEVEGYVLSKLLFLVTEGAPSAGMQRNQQLRVRDDSERWSTILLTSSNIAVSTKIDTSLTAGGQEARLWELLVHNQTMTEEETLLFQQMDDGLAKNCGVAGIPFIQHVIKNRETLQNDIRWYESEIRKRRLTMENDRFVVSIMACMFAAANILSATGIVEIDMSWLYKALERRKPTQKELDSATESARAIDGMDNVLEALADYTGIIYTGGGSADSPVYYPPGKKMLVRIEIGTKPEDTKIYISRTIKHTKSTVLPKNSRIQLDNTLRLLESVGVYKQDASDRKILGSGFVGSQTNKRHYVYSVDYGKLDPDKYGDYCDANYRKQNSNVVPLKKA